MTLIERNLSIIVEEESGSNSYQGTIGRNIRDSDSQDVQMWELTKIGSPHCIRPATPEEVGDLVYNFVLEEDHLRKGKINSDEEPVHVRFSITSGVNRGEGWPLVTYSDNYGDSTSGVRSYRELTQEEAIILGQRLEALFSKKHYSKTQKEIEREEREKGL